MNESVYTVTLQSRRDTLVARLRARQIAGLLGFDPEERVVIAAAVGEIARRAFARSGRGAIRFEVEGDVLRVFPVAVGRRGGVAAAKPAANPEPLLRLERPLPEKEPALAREDWAWAIEKLAQLTPLRFLDEAEQHDRGVLGLALQLQKHHVRAVGTAAGRPFAA